MTKTNTNNETLSYKQKCFVDEYLLDMNANAAYGRAGYKVDKGSRRSSSRLLHLPKIQSAVKTKIKERSERVGIHSGHVLSEIAYSAFFDPIELLNDNGTLKNMPDISADARHAIASFKVKEYPDRTTGQRVFLTDVKLVDKISALNLAGRHLGLFTDKVEVTGKDGRPMEYTDLDLKKLDDSELEKLLELFEKASPSTSS